jgi:cellulose synthase/poly-beta-1,6-N-acetylglucosamine synthase-like glycosyltransferase
VGLEAIGGFDKKLELNLLRAGYTIHYLPAAYVLDEKVRGAAVFQTQRTRWLAAQWQFAKESIGPACWQLITKGNVDYLDKAFQFILPPRILLFGLLGFVWFISLFMGLTWLIWSSILLVLTALTLLLGIPPTLLAAQRWQDIRQLPKAFGLMVLALTRIRHARRRFLHTPHTS